MGLTSLRPGSTRGLRSFRLAWAACAWMASALACAPAWASAESGLAAFRSGHFAEALTSWSDSAREGDVPSALYLGVLYDTGTAVSADQALAREWYRRAAAGGNVTAMFNVAVMLDAGRGGRADHAAAMEWYERAAAQGSGRAAYNLGLMHEERSASPADRAAAIRHFRTAARLGVGAAVPKLVGLGVRFAEPVVQPALRREDSAMQDFQRAQRMLLTRGVGEAEQAFALFRRAAEQGNALAEYNLAYCLEHGIGTPKDIRQAIVWYRRASSHASSGEIRTIAESGARNLSGQISQAQR